MSVIYFNEKELCTIKSALRMYYFKVWDMCNKNGNPSINQQISMNEIKEIENKIDIIIKNSGA